jgi:hypothetical protein
MGAPMSAADLLSNPSARKRQAPTRAFLRDRRRFRAISAWFAGSRVWRRRRQQPTYTEAFCAKPAKQL